MTQINLGGDNRREAAIGTGICADCGGSSKMDKGLCDPCHIPRKGRAAEITNPYKKVWNTVEDEESALMNAVRNGTLFVPTYAIIAERSRSTARYLKDKAERIGGVEGRSLLKDAMVQENLAESMDEADNEMKKLRKPKEFGFRVAT